MDGLGPGVSGNIWYRVFGVCTSLLTTISTVLLVLHVSYMREEVTCLFYAKGLGYVEDMLDLAILRHTNFMFSMLVGPLSPVVHMSRYMPVCLSPGV